MKIIICGSMSAFNEMVEIEIILKNNGHDVILPKFTHEYASLKKEYKSSESCKEKTENDLIRKYFYEIKSADAILVVNINKNNINGYIGGNSFLEMGFAYILNKKIYLLNDIPEISYKDEIETMSPVVLNGDFSLIINETKKKEY